MTGEEQDQTSPSWSGEPAREENGVASGSSSLRHLQVTTLHDTAGTNVFWPEQFIREPDEDDKFIEGDFFRGAMMGCPISLVLWAIVGAAAYFLYTIS